MSDQVAATGTPAPAPSAPPPAAPAAEPKPGDPRPSRFRTDATLAEDTKLAPRIAPIRETPPKDPATGKFVKADPNAGVIPELQHQQEQEQAEPVQEEQGNEQQQDETPPPPPAVTAPEFVPVEIDLGDGRFAVFKTKAALEAHFKRMRDAQAAADRRLAEFQQKAEPKAEEKPAEATKELRNPFETTLLDDEALLRQMYKDIDDPDKGPVIAVARVVDKIEGRMKEFVTWLQAEQAKAFEPMQGFLGAIASINQTGEFFEGMSKQVDPSTNEPVYPEFYTGPVSERRKMIRDLTQIMSRHNLPLTPENFDLAFQVYRGTRAKQGESQPQQEQPRDNTAAASAAAVMSGRGGRAPDPRADRRTPTFREEMDQVQTSRGRFRTGV